MAELYSAAWRMGVKTTYYLHMMPRHTAEQSTVKVNKAAEPTSSRGGGPRRGFGGASSASTPPRRGFGAAPAAPAGPTVVQAPPQVEQLPVVDEVDGQQCPIDPMERLQCDSCQ